MEGKNSTSEAITSLPSARKCTTFSLNVKLQDTKAKHYLLFIQANGAAKEHFQKALYNFLSPLVKVQLVSKQGETTIL